MNKDEIINYYISKHGTDPEFCKGSALHKHIPYIAILIQDFRLTSVLDFGCGKAQFWKKNPFWRAMFQWTNENKNLYNLWLYDPGYDDSDKETRTGMSIHNTLPASRYDLVICTDVLEHVPEEDIGFTLETILGKSRRFVYLNISCYYATKTFRDGTNVHVTVKPPSWWKAQIQEAEKRVFEKMKSRPNILIKFDEEK